MAGFLGRPDIDRPCGINGLSPKCRVCRVLVGGESPREFEPLFGVLGNRSRRSPGFGLQLRLQTEGLRRSEVCKSLKRLVGPPRFELGTSCTPSKRASQAAPRPDL